MNLEANNTKPHRIEDVKNSKGDAKGIERWRIANGGILREVRRAFKKKRPGKDKIGFMSGNQEKGKKCCEVNMAGFTIKEERFSNPKELSVYSSI